MKSPSSCHISGFLSMSARAFSARRMLASVFWICSFTAFTVSRLNFFCSSGGRGFPSWSTTSCFLAASRPSCCLLSFRSSASRLRTFF